MTEQDRDDLIKRLQLLGLQIEVLPLDTTITGHGMYVSRATFEEALVAFIGKALKERKEFQQWIVRTGNAIGTSPQTSRLQSQTGNHYPRGMLLSVGK
jgi:hypothetical protein